MKTISFSEARAHFKDLIDQVQAGESFQITRHGKVVAELFQPSISRIGEWEHLRNPPFPQIGMSEFLLEERNKDWR